jgi:hypothetical protein
MSVAGEEAVFVIGEDRLGQAVFPEGIPYHRPKCLQALIWKSPNAHEETRVVVQDSQRHSLGTPGAPFAYGDCPFEIELPQFIGLGAFEPIALVAIGLAPIGQVRMLHDAMHGPLARQVNALLAEVGMHLGRPPVIMGTGVREDALAHLRGGLPGRMLGPPRPV